MFFIYASFLEFIAVNYLARLKIFHFLSILSCKCPFPFRWVQDPEQQKKKKENAILDVRISLILNPSWSSRITMSSKSLLVVTIFHVNSYNSSWLKQLNRITMSSKSLRVVTVALNVHSATAKDAMHSIGGTVESRLKEVRQTFDIFKRGKKREPGYVKVKYGLKSFLRIPGVLFEYR